MWVSPRGLWTVVCLCSGDWVSSVRYKNMNIKILFRRKSEVCWLLWKDIFSRTAVTNVMTQTWFSTSCPFRSEYWRLLRWCITFRQQTGVRTRRPNTLPCSPCVCLSLSRQAYKKWQRHVAYRTIKCTWLCRRYQSSWLIGTGVGNFNARIIG